MPNQSPSNSRAASTGDTSTLKFNDLEDMPRGRSQTQVATPTTDPVPQLLYSLETDLSRHRGKWDHATGAYMCFYRSTDSSKDDRSTDELFRRLLNDLEKDLNNVDDILLQVSKEVTQRASASRLGIYFGNYCVPGTEVHAMLESQIAQSQARAEAWDAGRTSKQSTIAKDCPKTQAEWSEFANNISQEMEDTAKSTSLYSALEYLSEPSGFASTDLLHALNVTSTMGRRTKFLLSLEEDLQATLTKKFASELPRVPTREEIHFFEGFSRQDFKLLVDCWTRVEEGEKWSRENNDQPAPECYRIDDMLASMSESGLLRVKAYMILNDATFHEIKTAQHERFLYERMLRQYMEASMSKMLQDSGLSEQGVTLKRVPYAEQDMNNGKNGDTGRSALQSMASLLGHRGRLAWGMLGDDI